ncbi:MAG: hypothetical protein FWG63_07185 [Defluviitaleaceae bacterium]|nr:hypothetical protein [Defluviitaleaceae bacterium]
MGKFKKHYEAALALYSSKQYDLAVGRLYYAVLHCICDTLFVVYNKNIDNNVQHKFIREQYVNCTGLHELGRDISYWQSCRENADYQRQVSKQYDDNIFIEVFDEMLVFIQQQQRQQHIKSNVFDKGAN